MRRAIGLGAGLVLMLDCGHHRARSRNMGPREGVARGIRWHCPFDLGVLLSILGNACVFGRINHETFEHVAGRSLIVTRSGGLKKPLLHS
ncbi:hypothetical protein BS47DRAFT_543829 [Hydnum rufescens UP504]|uniref:Uncharacterized protein n=1 Tax=Hydnum rufescens UP504 TaxID=1448309 RepID=A0A9P6DZN4_9AGAM|nr:hypothetical protein BS47DRAFT_543829 [Hydnum rufescens UP504]